MGRLHRILGWPLHGRLDDLAEYALELSRQMGELRRRVDAAAALALPVPPPAPVGSQPRGCHCGHVSAHWVQRVEDGFIECMTCYQAQEHE